MNAAYPVLGLAAAFEANIPPPIWLFAKTEESRFPLPTKRAAYPPMSLKPVYVRFDIYSMENFAKARTPIVH